MRKLVLLGIALTLSLSVSFMSYAHDDLAGGVKGSVTWEEAKKVLDNSATVSLEGYSYDDIANLSWKRADYLIYICTSHQQDYDTYLQYANTFKQISLDYGYEFFHIMDEDMYNAKLKAVGKFSDFKSLNAEMIADSGFRADKNGLPFYNPTVKGITTTGNDVVTGGCCAGMSWFSMQNYMHGFENITFDYAKKYIESHYGSACAVKDWTVDLSDIKEVGNKNLYAYKPVTDDLKAKMAPKGRTEKDTKLVDKLYSIIDLNTVKGTKDERLLKAIALSAYTIFQIRDEENNSLWNAFQESESGIDPCPAAEIYEVQREFEKKRPVYIIMDNGKWGTHAVVGYALGRDKVQKNKYYIYTYNNNNPGNYGLTGTEKSDYYWIEAVVEKGADGKEYAYYEFREVKTPADEAAYKDIGGGLVSRYTGNFTFTSVEGVPLHCSTKADTFGTRLLRNRSGEPIY